MFLLFLKAQKLQSQIKDNYDLNQGGDDYVEDLLYDQLNRPLAAAFLLEETRKFISLIKGPKPSESVARAILLRNGWDHKVCGYICREYSIYSPVYVTFIRISF